MYKVKKNFFNPFCRQNPYYVPSKFYSEDVRKDKTSYGQPSFKYSQKQSSIIESKYSYNNQHSNKNYLSSDIRYSIIQTKDNLLKKKAINHHQNPFYKKNLLEQKNITFKDNYVYPKEVQKSISKKRNQTQSGESILSYNHNRIQIEKQSLPKISQKSQKSMKNISFQLISQRKTFKELYQKDYEKQRPTFQEKQPQTITINGKIFYLQNIL